MRYSNGQKPEDKRVSRVCKCHLAAHSSRELQCLWLILAGSAGKQWIRAVDSGSVRELGELVLVRCAARRSRRQAQLHIDRTPAPACVSWSSASAPEPSSTPCTRGCHCSAVGSIGIERVARSTTECAHVPRAAVMSPANERELAVAYQTVSGALVRHPVLSMRGAFHLHLPLNINSTAGHRVRYADAPRRRRGIKTVEAVALTQS